MGVYVAKPKKEYIWSPELAYAVGLITTDGCLSPDGRHFTVVSKDLEQLVNIKSILEIKANIGTSRSGRVGSTETYHRLQWGDVVLYNFLLGIGLTPNKSLTIGEVKVPDKCFFDFLRGHYDGDGCFYSYFDPRWKSGYMFYLGFASGSKDHLEWLRRNLTRLLGVKGSLSTHKQKTKPNPYHQLKFAKAETLLILDKIYPHNDITSLSRKRLKIEEALRIVDLRLPMS